MAPFPNAARVGAMRPGCRGGIPSATVGVVEVVSHAEAHVPLSVSIQSQRLYANGRKGNDPPDQGFITTSLQRESPADFRDASMGDPRGCRSSASAWKPMAAVTAPAQVAAGSGFIQPERVEPYHVG